MSARDLAALIRTRKLSVREVMAAHLERINRVNPTVNAIVAKLDDRKCLALADAADKRTAKGRHSGHSTDCLLPSRIFSPPWASLSRAVPQSSGMRCQPRIRCSWSGCGRQELFRLGRRILPSSGWDLILITGSMAQQSIRSTTPRVPEVRAAVQVPPLRAECFLSPMAVIMADLSETLGTSITSSECARQWARSPRPQILFRFWDLLSMVQWHEQFVIQRSC